MAILSLLIWSIFIELALLLSLSRNERRVAILVVISFLYSEIIFVLYSVPMGIAFYSLYLALLILILLFKEHKLEAKNVLIVLTILPIARLISSITPLQQFSFLARVVIVYSIMLVSAFIVAYFLKIDYKEMGHKRFKWHLALVMIAFGAISGLDEFFILRPERLFESLNLFSILIGLSIFISGYVEEFIFRGLLQNSFEKLFGSLTPALFLITLIFCAMHLIWNNFMEIGFVLVVGLFIGFYYAKTKNIFTVSLLHGSINFFLFIIWPYLLK